MEFIKLYMLLDMGFRIIIAFAFLYMLADFIDYFIVARIAKKKNLKKIEKNMKINSIERKKK